jgi:dephospho-CoA kinase
MVVPLLLESPAFLQLAQRILVVDCDESRQIERVMQRSKLSEAEVRTIMAQQAPRQQRLSAANDVIHNNGGFTSLTQQVEALHNVYFAAGKQNGD